MPFLAGPVPAADYIDGVMRYAVAMTLFDHLSVVRRLFDVSVLESKGKSAPRVAVTKSISPTPSRPAQATSLAHSHSQPNSLDSFSISGSTASTSASFVLDPPSLACPYGSLLSRFVFALMNLIQPQPLTSGSSKLGDREREKSKSSAAAPADFSLLNLRSVCLLWSEFVAELRFHWESGLPIPHLLSGAFCPHFAVRV